MLSLQEAIDFDHLDVMTSGFGGFTPWGPDTCPTLEQLMASSSSSVAAEEEEQGDEEELRRRQRRKMSNRLSARRSRARKQQRLEELRVEAAQLRAEKKELGARLHAVARHTLAARGQNARLRAEATALARRFREARRIHALQRLTRQLLILRTRPVQPGGGGEQAGPGAAAFAVPAAPAPQGLLASSLMT